jgi:hypothetical protein
MRAALPAALLAALIGWASAGRAAAAVVDARRLAYLPARYSPGEEVEIQALLSAEAGEKLSAFDLKAGSGLPVQGAEADPELRELRLAQTAEGWLLKARFVPWSPGARSLPALRVKGIALPALPFAAISVLGAEDRDISPPRRQRDPPGTALYLYGFAGFLLLLVLGAAGTAGYLVPAARALLARRRAAQAFGRFLKSLEYLARELGSAEPGIFFAALGHALRLYLSARALPEACALTAPELELLPEAAFPAPGTKSKAAGLIAYSDRIRYGGERPGPDALAAAIESARAIGEQTEEALLARV